MPHPLERQAVHRRGRRPPARRRGIHRPTRQPGRRRASRRARDAQSARQTVRIHHHPGRRRTRAGRRRGADEGHRGIPNGWSDPQSAASPRWSARRVAGDVREGLRREILTRPGGRERGRNRRSGRRGNPARSRTQGSRAGDLRPRRRSLGSGETRPARRRRDRRFRQGGERRAARRATRRPTRRSARSHNRGGRRGERDLHHRRAAALQRLPAATKTARRTGHAAHHPARQDCRREGPARTPRDRLGDDPREGLRAGVQASARSARRAARQPTRRERHSNHRGVRKSRRRFAERTRVRPRRTALSPNPGVSEERRSVLHEQPVGDHARGAGAHRRLRRLVGPRSGREAEDHGPPHAGPARC